ncbi:aromatic amino acid transaminase [Sphingorhabdus sp.]|jgi:aromatic-amino-acid transaminase|uniref:aromatic amino acid transaminase n=1 Tax=Sphingorhabdus sp. TaxID=1902408 RepID=UPI0037C57E20
MLHLLKPMPADPILQVISAHRNDPREIKIDLGVGVYKDETGSTPVFRAVKAAEEILVERQSTKSYLGTAGDSVFTDLLRPIIFASDLDAHLIPAIQTPGGGGALRLGAELIATALPTARIWLGVPSWPNHYPIFNAVGLEVKEYQIADLDNQVLLFDAMMSALEGTKTGDIVLLHGCCHNPTGLDLNTEQWTTISEFCAARGLVPFIDLAYQGLGESLEADAAGFRIIFEHVPELLLAYSCDKNFGLYRERTGALFVKTPNEELARNTLSNLAVHARVSWSMPPDHGAAVVRTILENAELVQDWRSELASMARRINEVRTAIAVAAPTLAAIGRGKGLFCNLALKSAQVKKLQDDHAIYLIPSGRLNVAGLQLNEVPRLVSALEVVGAFTDS